jgi:hypothetical protein
MKAKFVFCEIIQQSGTDVLVLDRVFSNCCQGNWWFGIVDTSILIISFNLKADALQNETHVFKQDEPVLTSSK